ncbi:hypothetical protein KKD57_03710, partial [Patescibacteria group bacterium]|nr:hypothetical protein [Patescibacteria group bacterium]
IIGILSSVVLVSLSGARVKANTAAYKAEMTSIVPGLILACDTDTLVATTVGIAAAGKHTAGTIVSQSCGVNGNGTFNITYAPVTSPAGTCTASAVTEAGATFTGC